MHLTWYPCVRIRELLLILCPTRSSSILLKQWALLNLEPIKCTGRNVQNDQQPWGLRRWNAQSSTKCFCITSIFQERIHTHPLNVQGKQPFYHHSRCVVWFLSTGHETHLDQSATSGEPLDGAKEPFVQHLSSNCKGDGRRLAAQTLGKATLCPYKAAIHPLPSTSLRHCLSQTVGIFTESSFLIRSSACCLACRTVVHYLALMR